MKAIALVLVVASLSLTGCSGCASDYSDGERTGIIVKFSRKGLVWKSWEGEMNLGGLKAVHDDKGSTSYVANIWAFHASEQMAPKIQEAMRKGVPVTLHYRQWAISPSSQDSDYDITSVEEEK